VSAARQGRKKQFEETALPHLGLLYRFAWQLAGQDGTEDLIQETYLRAWKYFDTFDPASNCRAWLFRILHNVWADHRARRRLEIPLAENELERVEPYYDWEDEFLDQQLSARVEQALRELPEKYRWAVLLADVEEFSYQEIAAIMGCPVGTVMSRLNRGRRTLARLLRRAAAEARNSRHPAGKTSREET